MQRSAVHADAHAPRERSLLATPAAAGAAQVLFAVAAVSLIVVVLVLASHVPNARGPVMGHGEETLGLGRPVDGRHRLRVPAPAVARLALPAHAAHPTAIARAAAERKAAGPVEGPR